MKILELFAGGRCIGKEAENQGHEVFSVDWQKFDGVHLSKDIEFLMAMDIPFIPDIIWASFDCTTYSIAAISHHRRGDIPISEYAKKSDRVNKNAIELIDYFSVLNPDLVYFIENPRGMLRKMEWMRRFNRHTVTYCQYGDSRMKPTDIFTNSKKWKPRPMCKNGDKCHASAPRGSKTGTQGLKGSYIRSLIPNQLCEEIVKSF